MLIESRQRLQTFNTPPSLLIDNAPIKLHLLNLLVFMWMRIVVECTCRQDCFWYWYLEEKWTFCYI